MPASVAESLDYVGGKLRNAPIVGGFAKNPFYTAILIVLIMMTIVFITFHNAEMPDDKPVWRCVLRAGVYSLLAVTAVQFVQNQCVLDETREEAVSAKVEEVFNESAGVAGAGEDAVKPDGVVSIGEHLDVSFLK